nr:MAG TPA: hypothetical protein [Caudoviricetes sp.]
MHKLHIGQRKDRSLGTQPGLFLCLGCFTV